MLPGYLLSKPLINVVAKLMTSARGRSIGFFIFCKGGMNMNELLAVAVGGSIGAVSRYVTVNYIMARWHCNWPWGTFAVNAAGCLVMGFLMVMITEKGLLPSYWRLLLCVGFLGGLTTFSSFSYESLTLLTEGNLLGAGANIVASVLVGIIFAWLGTVAARSL